MVQAHAATGPVTIINHVTGKHFAKYQTQIWSRSKVKYKLYATDGDNTYGTHIKLLSYSYAYGCKVVTVKEQEVTRDAVHGQHTHESN